MLHCKPIGGLQSQVSVQRTLNLVLVIISFDQPRSGIIVIHFGHISKTKGRLKSKSMPFRELIAVEKRERTRVERLNSISIIIVIIMQAKEITVVAAVVKYAEMGEHSKRESYLMSLKIINGISLSKAT